MIQIVRLDDWVSMRGVLLTHTSETEMIGSIAVFLALYSPIFGDRYR